MADVNSFFDSVETFLAAAKTKAADVAEQGVSALRNLADYIAGQAAGLRQCGPGDCTRLAALHAECKALCCTDNTTPRQANGAILSLILTLIEQALAKLIENNPTPTPNPATT